MAEQNLTDILVDISDFISLQDGQFFEGKFLRAQKVQSNFDPDTQTVQLVFELNGQEKTMSSVRLGRELVKAGIKEGDKAKITRVSTKGTKIEWKVEKLV